MAQANVRDFVITPEAAGVAGAVSYWRTGGNVNIEALTKAWKEAGLDAKLLRKEPEPETALRRAVLDLASRKPLGENTEVRTLVRPCQEPRAWAVVEETVVKGAVPVYRTLVIVRWDGAPQFEDVTADEEESENIGNTVLANYAAQQGQFDPNDITTWLVKLAYSFGAVTLRDSGGVYFIPRTTMDIWNKIGDTLEKATGRAHQVFRIPAMKNSEAVAAIVDAITQEAEKIAVTMEAELLVEGEDKLGTRAVKTRAKEIDTLIGKLNDYETLLGLQIGVRDRVEKLQANLAIAALTAETATS